MEICKQCRPRIEVEKNKRVRTVRHRTGTRTDTQTDNLPVSDMSTDVIIQEQRREDYISYVIGRMENAQGRPELADIEGKSMELQNLYSQWDSLELYRDILYRRYVNVDGTLLWRQLLVSSALLPQLLQQQHAGKTSGHFGISKTQQLVKKVAY